MTNTATHSNNIVRTLYSYSVLTNGKFGEKTTLFVSEFKMQEFIYFTSTPSYSLSDLLSIFCVIVGIAAVVVAADCRIVKSSGQPIDSYISAL